MDLENVVALTSAAVSVLTMIGTVITMLVKVGRYQEKIERIEKAIDGILTHEQLNDKLSGLRKILDTSVSALYDKINALREDAASSNRVSGLDNRVAAIRTDLEVLKNGVGRVVDTMASTEEAITNLLTEARGDEVRLTSLEAFRNEANSKIRDIELQLARLGDAR